MPGRIPSHLLPRIAAMVALIAGLALASFGTADDAAAEAGVTNNCPAGEKSVALYGGVVTRGMVGADSLDTFTGYCVQVIASSDWEQMSVAEFEQFDVLWIGNDECMDWGNAAGKDFTAADFAAAANSVQTWEIAIDPANVMIAGGDYDYHVYRNQGSSRQVMMAIIDEVSDGNGPGLVLQAGCFTEYGHAEPWFQTLGGTFAGLTHGDAGSRDPKSWEVNVDHDFNQKFGFTAADYVWGVSCHDGMVITPGSAVAEYNLQTIFFANDTSCFMMSDPAFPPVVPDPDIEVEIGTEETGYSESGERLDFDYLIENTGNVPLDPVTVTDSIGSTISCPATELGAGDSMTCDAVYYVAAADLIARSITNDVSVGGTTEGGVTVTATDSVTLDLTTGPPVLPPSCPSNFYQVLSGQLHELDPSTGDYVAIGPAQPGHYNAMAYRWQDSLFYAVSRGGYDGIATHEVIAVNPTTGETTGTGLISSSGKYTGDIDPDTGLFWIARGGREWQVVDLDAMTISSVSFSSGDGSGYINSADVSFVGGVGYGIKGSEMIKWHLDTMTWERFAVPGLEGHSGSWGSTWIAGNSTLYAANNTTGDVFVFANITTDNPSAVKIATAAETNSNDGASCHQADDPFTVDALDDDVNVIAEFPTPFAPLDNDIFPAGGRLELTGNGTATGVTVVNDDGTMTYEAPEEEIDTTVTLEYELCPGDIPSGHPWCDSATIRLHVKPGDWYPLPKHFSNCATVTASSDHGNVDDEDCTNVTVYSPLDGWKGASASSVGLGSDIEYYFDLRNHGWVTLDDVVLSDIFPEEFSPTEMYIGRWTPATHEATFSYVVDDDVFEIGTFTGDEPAWYALPAGVDEIRVSYGDVPPQFDVTDRHRVRATAIRPNRNGDWFATPRNTTNCAHWSAEDYSGDSACANVQVFQPAARPLPSKIVEEDHVGPMDEVSFVLTMRNSSGAQLPLVDPYLVDHLPPQLEFVRWEPVTAGEEPTFGMVEDYGSSGRTLLRWDFDRSFEAGQYYSVRVVAQVRSGTPVAQYNNQAVSGTNDDTHYVECASAAVPDLADLDQDGDTEEWQCVGTAYFNVVRKVLTEASMVVRGEADLAFLDATTLEEAPDGTCPDFGGYTYYPCVAQTRSLGNTDYLLEIENQGNVSLTDFILYNTMPYVGDTGVWEGTLTDQRQSEWRPTLVAPLTVLEAPPNAGITIEYSYSQNPCRPEMSIVGNPPGTAWPTGCIDDWGPAPDDLEDLRAVQSIRILGDFPIGGHFDGGERIVIGYDLDAAHGSPFGREIAWTTFAYTSTQVDTGERNLPSEPRKTGMVIKQPDNGIGDFVWLDLDRNGVQDLGEPGLNGIIVKLFGYDEEGDPVLYRETATSFLQADTSRPGYYFFGDVDPGTYFVVFEEPRVGWNPMLPGLGADDIDSDGSATTMATRDIVIGEQEIVLDIDQGYFIPGGPYHCEDDSERSIAGNSGRRGENDPRPCPT